jgi:DNA polymerase elongation subunit (family B)
MAEPKILYFDIETSLQLVAVFQLGNNDWIDPSSLVTERYIICASWQWEGDKKVHAVSVLDNPSRYKKDPHDDYHVVEALHKVLGEADVIIGHNSDNFDTPYVNTRALYHGFPALPPIASVDTYKVAKAKFRLNSNKLDYIGQFLKVGKKKPTSPGLWMRVLNGDTKAIKEMIEYNKHDVTLLRDVFMKLKPYVPNHLSRELFGKEGCPRCGSTKVQYRGYHRAVTRIYRRLQCQKCFGWFRLLKAEAGSTKHRVI